MNQQTDLQSTATTRIADRHTPLIRNCWYFAALSNEVGRTLISRLILGVKVVLYRMSDGEAIALHDRCRHRSFPLSKGFLEGDNVVCGYHGMTYGPDGRCTRVPASSPSNAVKIGVQRFKLVERGPILWIWMGNAAEADESLIIPHDFLGATGWEYGTGEFEIDANYIGIHENLLDLSHFSYLHADTVGTPEYASTPFETSVVADRIRVYRKLENSLLPPIYAMPLKLVGQRCDRHSDSWFLSPGAQVGHAKIVHREPNRSERTDYRVEVLHLITPMNPAKFHYQWFVARDFALGDTEAAEFLKATTVKAYLEDVAALQWIEEVKAIESEPYRELNFPCDKAGLEMRRIIGRMASTERQG